MRQLKVVVEILKAGSPLSFLDEGEHVNEAKQITDEAGKHRLLLCFTLVRLDLSA